MLYKDACNIKSNQKNLGTIKCSNLCTEIVQYTNADETAVCNLASISLKQFVRDDKTFDHDALAACARTAIYNLNKVIDNNYYPVAEAEHSNVQHRPVGLGVQGLADMLALMSVAYDSPEGLRVDREVFETLYYAAVDESCTLAQQYGAYDSFAGSPASQGKLQYDLWNQTEQVEAASRYDWKALKQRVVQHGLRNSLLIAPMPTASTSQILASHVESFSPLPSVCYQRRTLAGDHIVMMPSFVRDCQQAGIWTVEFKSQVLASGGDIKQLPGLPETMQRVYKSCYDMSQRWILDHAGVNGRGPFIDQSQSLNVFVASPTASKLSSMHMYAWAKAKLKTGMYYLRSKAQSSNTLSLRAQQTTNAEPECLSCGS
jgi:ribonucleoside-diphosphate reductase alpha subunit